MRVAMRLGSSYFFKRFLQNELRSAAVLFGPRKNI